MRHAAGPAGRGERVGESGIPMEACSENIPRDDQPLHAKPCMADVRMRPGIGKPDRPHRFAARDDVPPRLPAGSHGLGRSHRPRGK